MNQEQAKRVLVVDDEVSLCEALKARLEQYGFAVTTAYNAPQAWKEISAGPPDVMLLDIRLPDEDGYTFLRKLRSFRDPEDLDREEKIRCLPVIIITGTGEAMKPLFEQERISAYVTKPIDSTVMRNLIEEILRKRGRTHAGP